MAHDDDLILPETFFCVIDKSIKVFKLLLKCQCLIVGIFLLVPVVRPSAASFVPADDRVFIGEKIKPGIISICRCRSGASVERDDDRIGSVLSADRNVFLLVVQLHIELFVDAVLIGNCAADLSVIADRDDKYKRASDDDCQYDADGFEKSSDDPYS